MSPDFGSAYADNNDIFEGEAGFNVRPVCFSSLFGYLHAPTHRWTGVGVVIVSPLGRDARCAHMPMRILADRLAEAGFPTLRYDHLGSGDSLDLDDPAQDALPAWLSGMAAAKAELRARTGVRKVVVAGVRMGATLAALGATRTDGLILLAPVLNVRSWLRRLRFAGGAANAGSPEGIDRQPVDSEGLHLSAATAISLAKLDMSTIALSRGPALIAAQNAPVRDFAVKAAAPRTDIEVVPFPGFQDLFLDPTVNRPPDQLFDSVHRWLAETYPVRPRARPAGRAPRFEAPILRPPGAIEQPVTFAEGLQGVICEPESERRGSTAVLFCNTGGDPRAGVSSFGAHSARQLAILGISSLRFDFAGIGDSPAGDVRCHVYETSRANDIAAAIAVLADRGLNRVIVVGICSGAYHGLHAAWRHDAIVGAFAISPVKLVWNPGDTLNFGPRQFAKATQAYVKSMGDADTWRRAARGKIDFSFLLPVLIGRTMDKVVGLTNRYRANSPISNMKAFARRNGRACFIMGTGDASTDELLVHFGSTDERRFRRLNTSVIIVPELDHGLARRANRDTVTSALIEWLSAVA